MICKCSVVVAALLCCLFAAPTLATAASQNRTKSSVPFKPTIPTRLGAPDKPEPKRRPFRLPKGSVLAVNTMPAQG
jgi:hypothetical protein